jgi:hypothetical protein
MVGLEILSAHSYAWHLLDVSGQFHAPPSLLPEEKPDIH